MSSTPRNLHRSVLVFNASLALIFAAAADARGPLPSAPKRDGLTAQFALGPDNNQLLLLSTFESAKRNLKVNAYDFGHPTIADALIAAIGRGVTLELLLETQPFKNPARAMSNEGKQVAVRIFAAMRASRNPHHRIYLMGSNLYPSETPDAPKVKRRFNFNHAKYVIADDERLHISSENFTSTGHPNGGTVGNRGWDLAISEPATVGKFRQIFAEDIQTATHDVLVVSPKDRLPGFITRLPTVTNPVEESHAAVAGERSALDAIGSGVVKAIEVLTSPRALPGLERFLSSAKKSVDVEYMSLPSQWYIGRQYTPNPLVQHLVQLARTGVEVRALLNDDRVFREPGDEGDTANELTVDYLNQIARCHRLPIISKVVNTKQVEITYIHNKGMIVDAKRVLISSINGTRNSINSNRETAVVVDSPAAAGYFGHAFDHDWNKSSIETLTTGSSQCPPLPAQVGAAPARALATPWSMAF